MEQHPFARFDSLSTTLATGSRKKQASTTGLGFVAERLEQGGRWCTPRLDGGDRAGDIAEWLGWHYGDEPYAVIDDSFSGWSLLEAMDRREPRFADRVVLCKEHVCLLDEHMAPLVAALRRPGGGR